jgi:hypothetical protein
MSPKAIRANQEYFDLLAGDVFARLYSSFPVPLDLAAAVEFLHLGDKDEIDNDPGRLRNLYWHTVRWLADEGYLRMGPAVIGDEDDAIFTDVVLTTKGLEALRKTPGALGGGTETIGDKIKTAAKDVGSDAGKTAMRQLVGQALGWVIKGVTGV